MASKKTVAERREELQKKMAILKAREQALAAQESAQKRKLDTRRKIVFGGALMAHASLDPKFAALLGPILDKAVTKDADRDLLQDWLTGSKDSKAENLPQEKHADNT